MTSETKSPRAKVVFADRGSHYGFSTFDAQLIGETADVTWLEYASPITPRYVVRCLRAAGDANVGYAFFAAKHALIPAIAFKLRRKRFVVSVGGYDVAADQVHGYGLARRRRTRWVPSTVIRLADAVLPFSEAARAEVERTITVRGSKVRVIPMAVDPAQWRDPGVSRDPGQVVTTGSINEERWYRKGIDRFCRAAAVDPERRYVLAGAIEPSVKRLIPSCPNLTVTGRLDQAELSRLFWSSGTYAQLSWHEGFGLAMAEAMTCGCVPVITDLPALREVAGPWAVVTAGDDVDAFDRASSTAFDRDAIRLEVTERFSVAARRGSLLDALLP